MDNKELKESFINEKARIEYKLVGDYYLPNLVMKKEKIPAGKYALMRYNYLRAYKNYELTILIMNEKLNKHLTEIQESTTKRVNQVIKEMMKIENVTEEIKANNQMEWVRCTNSIRNRAEEIVLSEKIFV